MTTTKIPIGIDFGTTYSTVAYVVTDSKGRLIPRSIPVENDVEKIPTAVYYSDTGYPIVGNDALTLGSNTPERLYTEFKRNLDPDYPFLGTLSNGEDVSANDLAGYVLQVLLNSAAKADGNIQKPVICHPVGDRWAKLLVDVMRKLGTEPIPLSEPVAVLYYAHAVENIFDEKSETVLLIDFGGGTCDFLLMKVKASMLRGIIRPFPEIIDEDRLDFGGKDIDQLIRAKFMEIWLKDNPKKKNLLNQFEGNALKWMLASAAKEKKEILSRNYQNRGIRDAIPVRFNDLPGKTSLNIELSYDDLKNITKDEIFNRLKWLLLIEDTDKGHRPLLGRKGIKPDDVTTVILAGGSSQLPWLKDEILPQIFPSLAKKKRIILLRNSEMAVAYGAALFAHDTLSENKHKLPRYMMKDLRVELQNGEAYPLVERGSRLPLKIDSYKAFHAFKFPSTGKNLTINLVEGNEHRAAQCRPLSYKEKTIEFDEEIKENTLMQLRVNINIKGEIVLELGKVGFATKKYQLIYNPLETSTKVEGK